MIKKIIMLTAAVLILTVTASASAEDILNAFPEELADALPEGLTDMLSGGEEISADKIGSLGAGYFFGLLRSALRDAAKDFAARFAPAFAALIITAVISACCKSLSGAVSTALRFVCALCTGMAFYGAVKGIWTHISEAVSRVTLFMSAILPSMTALCASSGSVSTAAAGNAGFSILLTLLERLCSDVLLPLLNVCFALSLTNSLSEASPCKTNGAAALVRNIFTLASGAVMLVFCLSLKYQTKIAASADGALLRSVKFAAGSFLPLVGGSISEAAASVLGSIERIKTASGTAAAVTVVAAFVPVTVETAVCRIAMGVISAAAGLLGCEREAALSTDLGSLLSLGIGVLISCAAMLLINLAVIS